MHLTFRSDPRDPRPAPKIPAVEITSRGARFSSGGDSGTHCQAGTETASVNWAEGVWEQQGTTSPRSLSPLRL